MEQPTAQTEDVNWEPLSEVRRAGTQNPLRDEGSSTGGERNALWQLGGSVNHGQEVAEPQTGGQGSHQIQMDMRKSSTRDRSPWDQRLHLRLDLTLLTLEIAPRGQLPWQGQATQT